MNFTPTTNIVNCMTQLLLTLQVLLTLVMPLRTTMTMTAALPVTSKPIENTAENLAWQAWLMLPPEQKQLMKSRKVTPKSIFTLPLRVECPEGHQQVDMKCIPTAIGSNAVLIDPNVLGLVLGETPGDIDYDYEDETAAGTGTGSDLDILSSMYLSDSEKSNTDAVLSLQPPSKDEPLKFNIFQSKFPTDDYPLEDYSAISNEAVVMAPSKTLNGSVGITQNKDLITEASNVSKSHSINGLSDSTGDFSLDNLEAISLPASPNHNGQQHKNRISLFNEDAALHLVTTLMDMEEGTEKDSTLSTQQTRDDLESLLQTESLMPMLNHTTVATTMPEESLTPAKDDDGDDFNVMERLALHVEDMVEMTTVMAPPMDDPESEEHKEKVEHIRSVTMNSLYLQSNADADEADQGDKDEFTTLTPSTVAEEDELESGEITTMPTPIIQLDDTTVIVNNNNGNGDDDYDEGFITTPTTPSLEELLEASPITTTATSSSPATTSSTTPSSSINDVQELLLPQNLAEQDFEELQRMRKGQKDQNTMEPKKSKVEPVEVPPPSSSTLQINTAATTPKTMETKAEVVASKTTTTTSTTPSSTMDELISQETVTPLLTVQHNNDDSNNAGHGDVVANNNNNNHNNHIDNNDRFYYQHIAQQDLESAAASATTLASDSSKLQEQSSTTTPKTAIAKADTAKAATTSEIDLAEELRLINELVKGNRQRPGQASTMRTTTSSSSSGDVNEATVSTSAAPLTLPSESSSGSMKFKLETTQIWSKIMPLLQTSSTTTSSTGTEPEEISTSSESSSIVESSTSPAAAITTTNITPKLIASNRSHRNSKIIRINRLNTIESNLSKGTTTTTTTTEDISTTTEQEEITSSTASSSLSHTENSDEDQEDDVIEDNSYEPFWWFPVGWRLDSLSSRTAATTTTTTTPKTTSQNHSQDDMPLLLRFWSTYHAPKSS